ncbi:MAG TPA: MFS transporter [Gaiellales bacterium]|jgi:EmrB/QacA subfamily drug resistance transporter|nr:MFS transporter [Gaiellales bacterium]
MPTTQDRKGIALLLLCMVQFMVVLDIAIVNVALPTIKNALDFKETDLQWVINAYTLTFGGLLMLGGRAADLLGRRRMFLAGLVLFSAASLVCGLSTSEGMLIAARAVQGVGAAIISPAALSILMTTFSEGSERNKALGIWGAIAGTGGAAGVLLGGVLTDQLNWSWIFYINVPVGALVIALGPRYLRESRIETAGRRSFDLLGAVLVTGGLSLLVYALVQTVDHSWSAPRTIAMFIGAAVLLGGFIFTEQRAESPLMPLRLFRNKSLAGANVVGLMLGASIFSMFFLLTLYMQQVLGYSAMRTGIGYLLVASTIIVSAAASQALVTKIGVRTVLAVGMALTTAGLLYFSQVSVNGAYLTDLAPGFILAGVGLGFSFVPVTIAALVGVEMNDAGIASGIINTSQQIGGALGTAILSTVAFTRVSDYLTSHAPAPDLLLRADVDGFSIAFLVGAGLSALGLLATLTMVPGGVAPEHVPEEVTEPVAA